MDSILTRKIVMIEPFCDVIKGILKHYLIRQSKYSVLRMLGPLEVVIILVAMIHIGGEAHGSDADDHFSLDTQKIWMLQVLLRLVITSWNKSLQNLH